jgi:hypothetical protein
MNQIKLTPEESMYLAYRDGGDEKIIYDHCELLGITIEEGKEMIRRQYQRRKEAGVLQPYDKTI